MSQQKKFSPGACKLRGVNGFKDIGLWVAGERQDSLEIVTGVLWGLWECVKIIMECFRKGPQARKRKNQRKGNMGLIECKQVAGQDTYLTEPYA